MSQPKLPTGAGRRATAQAALVDIAPLSQPCNPFFFMRAELSRYKPAPAQEALHQGQLEWLQWLENNIPAEHNQPLLLHAVGLATINGEYREWLMGVLQAVQQVVDGVNAGAAEG